jgi:hypothetical protein
MYRESSICNWEMGRWVVCWQIQIQDICELDANLIEGLIKTITELIENATIEQYRKSRRAGSQTILRRVHCENNMKMFGNLLSEPTMESIMRVQHQAIALRPSLRTVISAACSSPSDRPGTSALGSSIFVYSKNPESRALDSSTTKEIFSPLQPARRRTVRCADCHQNPLLYTCRRP